MVLEPSSSRDQEGSPDCPVQAVTRQLHLPAGCCQQVLPCQTVLGFPITLTMSMETTPVPWAPPQQKDMTFTTARGDEPPPLQGQVPPAPSQGGVSRGVRSPEEDSHCPAPVEVEWEARTWILTSCLLAELASKGTQNILQPKALLNTTLWISRFHWNHSSFQESGKCQLRGKKNHYHNLRSEVRRLWQEFSSSYNTKQYCTRQLQAWLK